MTTNTTVIVGRKTMEDFPNGKPLKNRRNIVVTRQDIEIDGAEVAHSVDEAITRSIPYETFVIGGASVFEATYPNLNTVFVTKIDAQPASDSFFPNLDESHEWKCLWETHSREYDGVKYKFCKYIRTNNGE